MFKHNAVAKAINYMLDEEGRWEAFTAFVDDGHLCMTNNAAERVLRGIAKRGSLCDPSSSVCKHWKCVRIDDATRAALSGYGSLNHLRGEIFGTDLIRRSTYNLHRLQYARFDKVPCPVVCYAQGLCIVSHSPPFSADL